MGQEAFPDSGTDKGLLGAQREPPEPRGWESPEIRELTVHRELFLSGSPQTGSAAKAKRGSRPPPSWVAAGTWVAASGSRWWV